MLYLEIGLYYLGMIVVSYVKFSKEHDEIIKFKIKMAAFAENVNLVFKYKYNLPGNTSGQNLYFFWIPWFIFF